MTVENSFQVDGKFWDDEHFPYGFARSGDFSLNQAGLLEKYGRAYIRLARGERAPVSNLEKSFVAFCQGKKEADNDHEKTWQRYQIKITRHVSLYSLAATASKTVRSDSYGMEAELEAEMEMETIDD